MQRVAGTMVGLQSPSVSRVVGAEQNARIPDHPARGVVRERHCTQRVVFVLPCARCSQGPVVTPVGGMQQEAMLPYDHANVMVNEVQAVQGSQHCGVLTYPAAT